MGPIVWDLSTGEEISRVGWPKDWPLDRFTFEEPGEIEVILLGGERHRLTPDQVYVARVGDRLTVVSFELPPMELDLAYSEATRLAAEWRITDLEELKKWYSKRQIDGGNTADVRWTGIRNTSLPRPRGLEVRPSYNPELPWTIRIGFGWPDNDPRSVEARKRIEESYRKGHRSSPQ